MSTYCRHNSPCRESCSIKCPPHNASHERCAVELAHILGYGNESVDKQVCVADHVLILCLHPPARMLEYC